MRWDFHSTDNAAGDSLACVASFLGPGHLITGPDTQVVRLGVDHAGAPNDRGGTEQRNVCFGEFDVCCPVRISLQVTKVTDVPRGGEPIAVGFSQRIKVAFTRFARITDVSVRVDMEPMTGVRRKLVDPSRHPGLFKRRLLPKVDPPTRRFPFNRVNNAHGSSRVVL